MLTLKTLGHHQNGEGREDDGGWLNVKGGGELRKWEVDGGWSYETQMASDWVSRSFIRAWYYWLKFSCCWYNFS